MIWRKAASDAGERNSHLATNPPRCGGTRIYQLSAQAIRPDNFVAMAAYAEGLGYFGNEKAYGEGGYKITISATTLAAEKVIMDGVRILLQ